MKRRYQSRRRKTESTKSTNDNTQSTKSLRHQAQHESPPTKTNMDINTNIKTSPIVHKYHRKTNRKPSPKPLTSNLSQSPQPKRKSARLLAKKMHNSDRADSVDSTTSFLSALSLKNSAKNSTKKPKNPNKYKNKTNCKPVIIDNDTELTLDDICNDAVDISEQYFDPESIAQYDDEDWPSWVSKDMIQVTDSPPRKRKRTQHNEQGSPPSKKLKSPNQGQKSKKKAIVFSTVRKNKKRARRRSSLAPVAHDMVTPCRKRVAPTYDMETPIAASLRTQRIHRLTRKSNTDVLFDVLLRETDECNELKAIKQEMKLNTSKKRKKAERKLIFKDINGLKCVGRMDGVMEKLCLYLLTLGADPLLLNSDGVSAIYIAMHYKNNYKVVSAMISKCVMSNYEELNQTYIFAAHGTMSLLDIALRVGEVKTVKLLLENDLMPTRHSVDYEPKVELISFCKQHRMMKLGQRVLKEQLFEAVDNLDVAYLESILCHGMDVNAKIKASKSSLYYLVQEPFDIYDELDAKDQYETIVCLLKNGANPNDLDTSRTPMLIYPMQRSGPWNIKLVDILLYYGAKLNTKVGHTSQSLYVYAKENCVCDEIIKIITNYYQNKKTITNSNNNAALNSSIKTKNVVTKTYQK
eukprot:124876_1